MNSLDDARDYFVLPELQVLRGNIISMFLLYERSVRQDSFASPFSISLGPTHIYFHKVLISFSSKKAKEKWLSGAEELFSRHIHHNLSHSMRGGDIDIKEIGSTDVYGDFLDNAVNSATELWTALFFTYDQCWHYWGAVLKYDAAQSLVKIYIHTLNGSEGSTLERQTTLCQSHKKLQRVCRARNWRTRIQFHEWNKNAEIDLAFGWTRIWG